MARIHRAQTSLNKTKRGTKHACVSAPAVPANLTVNFRQRVVLNRTEWNAQVKWDAVTADVNGKPLTPEEYQVELKACDASGDPVETPAQDADIHTPGSDFTNTGGTTPTSGKAIAFDASGDAARSGSLTITGGIDHQVDFYARKYASTSNVRVTVSIYDVTAAATVATKNASLPEKTATSNVIGTLSFTPTAGHTYQARVAHYSGTTGSLLFDGIFERDKGDEAVWFHRVNADFPTVATFHGLPRPSAWYYKARIRTLNRIHGGKCFSAWSAWTTPQVPATGALVGPPAVTGTALTFYKDAAAGSPWRVRVKWNEVPHWLEPGGESVSGAAFYYVQLQTSDTNGGTVISTRKATDDADPTASTNTHTFGNIRGTRWYRSRVKPVDAFGRVGAWTSWTSWSSPAGAPAPPTSVVVQNPAPRVIRVSWTHPTDETDVDRYKVEFFRNGTTSVDTLFVGKGSNRVNWYVPDAEYASYPRASYTAKVSSYEAPYAIDPDDGAGVSIGAAESSTVVTSSSVTDNAVISSTVLTSDGSAPSSAPSGVTVLTGPGYLLVKWTPITNADPVTYKVFVRPTSAPTTTDNTYLVASTAGTFAQIAKDATGTAIAVGTTYNVKVVATDADTTLPYGAAATSSNVAATVTGGALDIKVGTLSALTADMGAITAGTVTGATVQTASSGQRVVMDTAGIHAYDSTGDAVVDIPTDEDGIARFSGVVQASGLSSNGTTLAGTTQITSGAVTLGSTSTPDPTSEATVDGLASGGSLTANKDYFFGYSWYSATGPKETLPIVSVDSFYTGRTTAFTVWIPPSPSGVTQARVYVNLDTTFAAGGGHLQTTVNVSRTAFTKVNITSYNASGAASVSTSTYTTGGTASTLSTAANGFSLDGNSNLVLPQFALASGTKTPTSAQIAYDSTIDAVVISNARYWQPIGLPRWRGPWIFDEFICAAGNEAFMTGTASGTGAAVAASAPYADHPGLRSLDTGTTNSGSARYAGGTSTGLFLGDGQVIFGAVIKVPVNLATNTQDYEVVVGLMDTFDGSAPTNGVLFQYDRSVNSGAWRGRAATSGTVSSDPLDDNTAAVTVAADTWYTLLLIVNAAATSVTFYINGVAKGSLATNIPSGVTLQPRVFIRKTAGVTSRTMFLDAALLAMELDR